MSTDTYNHRLSILYRAIQELTAIRQIDIEFSTLHRAFDSLTRCNGKVSGNHCIHKTGHNCSYPDHHRPEGVAKGKRIRSYIKSNTAFDIMRAQLNETYYQRAVTLNNDMADLRLAVLRSDHRNYARYITAMTKLLEDLKGIAREADLSMPLPFPNLTAVPVPAVEGASS